MKKLIKIPAALLLSALCTHPVYAQPDFDNADIPPGFKAYTFLGGCGTVVKFAPIENVQPRYSDRQPDQRNVYTGGLLAGVLSAIPGVGFLAAAAVDAATGIVGSAISNAVGKEKDETAIKEQQWENVYLLTVKPDYGPEFTIPYEKLNQKTPDIGSRVRMSSDAFLTDRKFHVYFAGNKDLGDSLSEEYVSFCHGGTRASFPENMKVRQLSYNGNEFEWKKVDPGIQASVDGYYAKNKAQAAKEKEDAAEAEVAKNNESR